MNDYICLSDKTMSLSEEDLTRKETKNEPLGSDDSRVELILIVFQFYLAYQCFKKRSFLQI